MRVLHMDYDPFRRLVLSVDYPIWTVFLAIAYPLDRLMAPLPGWLSGAVGAVLVALLLLGIPLFWYLVVAEIEMRRHGKSMLRFSGWIKELLALTVLLLFSAGAFILAHAIARTILPQSWGGVSIFLVPAYACKLLSVLILTAWGIVLAGLAIHDLIALLKGEAPRASTAGS
jgi:hypothetical protein